jgi:hypothetical protein
MSVQMSTQQADNWTRSSSGKAWRLTRAANLIESLINRGMSVWDIAECVNRSHTTVYNIRNGNAPTTSREMVHALQWLADQPQAVRPKEVAGHVPVQPAVKPDRVDAVRQILAVLTPMDEQSRRRVLDFVIAEVA